MAKRLPLRAAVAVAAWFVLVASSALGEESAAQNDKGADDRTLAASDRSEPESEDRRWQVFFGAANLWPKLDESEARIDKLINGYVGSLFPRWEEPRTFKDWRDDFMLWDFQIGLSREINPKWDYYVAVGAVYGYQPNSKRYYPLGIPLDIDVEFERQVLFVSTGADYFPWGKAECPEGAGNAILPRLKAARPYAELFVTYIDLKGRAEGSFKLPGFGEFAHYQDKARYDLIGIGPRVGIDIPVTKNNSISFAFNPIIFTSHQREFDTLSVSTFLRHRF
jgi:hypothetical protein